MTFIKGHPYGKRFTIGQIPWNRGVPCREEIKRRYSKERKGISMPKPIGFSDTMRKVNPPIGIKKRFDARDKDKKIRVWRDGYVMLYKPEHPSSRKVPPDFGYILEHRMVMEDIIKRRLKPSEVIHHIDGCKSNNVPANLLLCEKQRDHNQVHTAMETFIEKLIREGKVFYDKEKKEFRFR